MDILEYKNYLVSWIREKVKAANAKGVIVGLSGGVDSSVVAALAKESFPNDSLGLFLPIGNMGVDLEDSKAVASKLSLNSVEVNLTEAFKAMEVALGINSKLAIANVKPRLRMTALYALAQEHSYLVLGTDNAAEWMLGYFTKYGDGGVDLLPIVHLLKGEVKQLAKSLDLPSQVYQKKPSAALWEGQTDEEELGFSYDEVDKFLSKKPIEASAAKKIEHQVNVTQHKRDALPMPKPWKEANIW